MNIEVPSEIPDEDVVIAEEPERMEPERIELEEGDKLRRHKYITDDRIEWFLYKLKIKEDGHRFHYPFKIIPVSEYDKYGIEQEESVEEQDIKTYEAWDGTQKMLVSCFDGLSREKIEKGLNSLFDEFEILEIPPVENDRKAMFLIYHASENRILTRTFSTINNIEEHIVTTLKNYNAFYDTCYKRKDLYIVQQTENVEVKLQKAEYRIGHLVKSVDTLLKERNDAQRQLKQLRTKMDSVSEIVKKVPLDIAKEVYNMIVSEMGNMKYLGHSVTDNNGKLKSSIREKVLTRFDLSL